MTTKKVSRRQVFSGAMAAGAAGLAASAMPRAFADHHGGMSGGASSSLPQQVGLPNVWGEDFLFQWSPPENLERDLTPGDSVLRLASSNSGLRNDPGIDYDSQFKAWKKAGWTACETWSNHWLSRKMSDSETRNLKQSLKDNDMVFYGIHAAGNIIAPGEAGEASRRHIVETIHAAADMDCKLVLTHAGSMHPSRDAAHPQNWSKNAWEQSVAALKSICADTAGIDVQIPIEAVNSESVNNPWAHKRLIEDVGDPRIGVGLDVTNFVYPGFAFRMTELLNLTFDLLGDHITYVHAKDLVWDEMLAGLNWAVQGTGLVDYETMLARASRLAGPEVFFLIEFLDQDEKYLQAQRNIRSIADSLGVQVYGTQEA